MESHNHILDSYNRAIFEVASIVEKGLASSLIHYGNISNPGVSDLDFIFVDNGEWNKDKFLELYRAVILLSDDCKKIIGDASIITIPHKLSEHLRIFSNININNIYGEHIDIKEYPDKKDSDVTLLRLLDYLPERLLLCARMKENISFYSVRHILGFLKSVGYSMRQSALYHQVENNGYNQYEIHVNKLRSDPNALKVTQIRLQELLISAECLLKNELDRLITLTRDRFGELEKSNSTTTSLNIYMKGRGIIRYTNNTSTNIKISYKDETTLELPISAGLNWISMNNYVLSKFSKDIHIQNLEEKRSVINMHKSEVSKLLSVRSDLAELWVRYKLFYDSRPAILKYNFVP